MSPSTNALFLSVAHDADSYRERMKQARYFVGQFSIDGHTKAIRPIVNARACLERAQFGSKFKAADITMAAREVAKRDRDEWVTELAAKVSEGGAISARARLWFDSINGNTYHSVRLCVAGETVDLPMQYGYGDQWMDTACQWLEENEVIPAPSNYSNGMRKCQKFPISWGDAPYGLKRDLFGG